MSTYAELKAKAEAMMAEAEELRKAEIASAVAEIKQKMRDFGIGLSDLVANEGLKKGGKKIKSNSGKPAKYRGPNGELWPGGLGRKPQWVRDVLAQGKNLDDYLI